MALLLLRRCSPALGHSLARGAWAEVLPPLSVCPCVVHSLHSCLRQLWVPAFARCVLGASPAFSGPVGPWQRLWASAHAPLPTDAPRQPMFTARLDLDTAGAGAGRRGLLLCRVDSDPPAQLRLLHRDRVVASSLPSGGSCSTCGGCSQRTKVTRAPNLLRVEIQDPVLEDEGMYLCEASSLLGNASASATFDAQGEAGQGKSRSGSGAGTRDPIPLQPPALRWVYWAKPPLVSSGRLLSSPCPTGTPEGLLPTPSRQGGWTTGPGVWGEDIKVRPVSVGLCCLFSSHCPGHHTIAHAAGGHWSQSDLQGGPGSRWPCQLLLVPGWGTVGPGPPGDPDAAACDQKGCCPVCLPHPHRGWCPALHPCGPECALWVMGKGRSGPLEGGRGGLGETGLRLGLGRQELGSGVGKCRTELRVCV